jgi:hypothetical protein
VVQNNNGAVISPPNNNNRIVITPESGAAIDFVGNSDIIPTTANTNLDILGSTGIDCGDDGDDGFDDEVLALLLLELLEDNDDFVAEDDDGPAVSAPSEDGQAEASTPGAVARSGDPDDLSPLRSTPDNVVDELPTSGSLPNTGGMPLLYWLLPLAGLLLLAGLPIYRWAKRRE